MRHPNLPGSSAARNIDKKEREDIRREAFKEAAELVRKTSRISHWTSLSTSCLVPLSKAILDLGEPKPDPRTRRITVQLKEGTYSFDRDREHPVQRFRITGAVINEDADLLLHVLEQERTILFSARRASYSACSCWPHFWSERDAARLAHLNLFLDGGEERS